MQCVTGSSPHDSMFLSPCGPLQANETTSVALCGAVHACLCGTTSVALLELCMHVSVAYSLCLPHQLTQSCPPPPPGLSPSLVGVHGLDLAWTWPLLALGCPATLLVFLILELEFYFSVSEVHCAR